MDHMSAFSDIENGDDFMAESEGVMDSDSHSLPGSVRSRFRRKRQSSISDVSSISEGSASKRRGATNANGLPYLSAENLARLEEHAEEEDIEEVDDTRDDDEDSFLSAVSISHVKELSRNLDEDINETNDSLARVQAKLAELRSPENAGFQVDHKQQQKLKIALRLEVERIHAELLAMRASREDLMSRIAITPSSAVSVSRNANQSVEMASILLLTRKKRGSVGIEDSLSGNRSRRKVQLSGSVESVTGRFLYCLNDKDEECPCFWFQLSNSTLVFISTSTEKKVFVSAGSLSSGINYSREERSQHVFVGGTVDDYHADLLSSRFPYLMPPSSGNERLLRLSITNSESGMGTESLVKRPLTRIRIAAGDFQVAPGPSYVAALKSLLSSLRQRPGTLPAQRLREKSLSHDKLPKIVLFDLLVTLSSCKVLDGDTAQLAAIISDITIRASGDATSQIYKDKMHLDLRLGGVQILYLGQRGMTQPLEVLRKRESYSPFLRARIRGQSSMLDDEAGWIVGHTFTRAFNAGMDLMQTVRNIHASLQIEPLDCMVSTEILGNFTRLARAWNLAFRQEPNEAKNRSLGPRWMIDVLLKRITIQCASGASDLQKKESDERLVVDLSLSSALQRSAARDTMLRMRVDDMSIHFPAIQTPLLSSFSISFLCEKGSKTFCQRHHETPIVREPAGIGWVCSQGPTTMTPFPDKGDRDTDCLLTVLTSPCNVKAHPRTVAIVAILVKAFMDCLKEQQVAGQPKDKATRSLRL